MFKNFRVSTSGISYEIPEKLQNKIWELVDKTPVKKDYIQAFKIKQCKGSVTIKQKQEYPIYVSKKHFVKSCSILKDKTIFVIDDGEKSIMMLAEEY